MLPVVVSFVSTFFFAGSHIFTTLGLKHGSNPFTCSVFNIGANAVFLWMFALAWEPMDFLYTPYVWMFAALGIFVPGLARHFFFIGLEHIGPSRATVVSGVTPLMSSLAAIIILGEAFKLQTSFGTLSIVAGIMLMSLERSDQVTFDRRFIWYPLAGCVMWALRDNLARIGLKAVSSPFTAAAVATTTGALFFLALSVFSSRATRLELNRRSVVHFIVSGLFAAFAYLFIFTAFALGDVTRAGPPIYTTSLATIVLSSIFLRRVEVITARVVISGLIIVGGVILISFS